MKKYLIATICILGFSLHAKAQLVSLHCVDKDQSTKAPFSLRVDTLKDIKAAMTMDQALEAVDPGAEGPVMKVGNDPKAGSDLKGIPYLDLVIHVEAPLTFAAVQNGELNLKAEDIDLKINQQTREGLYSGPAIDSTTGEAITHKDLAVKCATEVFQKP